MDERSSDSETADPQVAAAPAHDLEGEAMRRRIGARLFGAASEPLRIGRFRVQRTLGRGGMGVVYAAEDDTLGRSVALKVIRPDVDGSRSRERQRLLDEARALARLAHPNVVGVHEVGEHGDDIFIAMEYVGGCTLLQWLASPHTRAEIVALFIAAGRGLAAAHAAGLVHRDFKPGNVLVGEDGRARIVDFGLARGPRSAAPESSTSLSEATSVSDGPERMTEPRGGTPGYMSPEQALGQGCDARSDQFSFCVALHEALYGRRPFRKNVVAALVHQDVLRPAMTGAHGRVPGWLRKVLTRGLAFAPEARFASMDMLLVALSRGSRWPSRTRWVMGAAVGLAVVAGVVTELRAATREVCPATSHGLLATWSPARRDEVRRAFQATQPEARAEAAWAEVARPIDRYAGEWARASRDACEETLVRGERTGRSLFARRVCLGQRLGDLGHVIELVERRDPATAEGARELIARLPAIARCDDADASIDVAVMDRRREQAHADFGFARQLQRAGRGAEARRRIDALLMRAREIGDRHLEVGVLLLRGTIEGRERRDFLAGAKSLIAAAAIAGDVDGHPARTEIWNELAWQAADLAEDVPLARMYLRLAEGAGDGPVDPLLLASRYETEAQIEILVGDLERVEALRQSALELREAVQGSEHPDVARGRMMVANVLAYQDKPALALVVLQQLRDEQVRRLGESHPSLLAIERSLALVHRDLGELGSAEITLLRARAEAARLYGEASGPVASLDLPLALVEAARDKPAAIRRLRGAITVLGAYHAPGYLERVRGLQELANLLLSVKETEAALAVNLELLSLHDHGAQLEIDGVLVNIGDFLCLLERCDEAVVAYTRLLNLRRDASTPGAAGLPLQGLGRVYLSMGQPRLALGLLEQAREAFIRTPRPTGHMLEQTTRNLAACLRQLGEVKRAREMLAEADRLTTELQ